MSIVEYYGDSSPRGIIRHWERKTKSDCAYEILRCWKRIEELEKSLAQQQEAEPVGHVRYITAGGNAGLSWVVDQSGPTCGGPIPRDGQPLYLHPPITAAQPACCRKTPCEHPPGMGPCDKPAALPQIPEGYKLVPVGPPQKGYQPIGAEPSNPPKRK